MKPEEQRIAIAEACGAKWMNRWSASHATLTFMKEGKGSSNPDWSFCHKDEEVPMDDTIPDYLHDLNAMHEAEKILNTPIHMQKHAWNNYKGILEDVTKGSSFHATAVQRAEAFLKTLNLWKHE